MATAAPPAPSVTASTTSQTTGPQMRSRITVVCGECKRLKLKCDRRNPCASCVKRDTVSRCIYSPAAAEKVDLHSLNNRMIQVETTLTQLTSGIAPPPFQSAYPPSSSSALQQSPPNDTAMSQLLPTSSTNPCNSTPGPSNTHTHPPPCNRPSVPLNQPYHSVFSPPCRGDRSAMGIPAAVIFGTFLAGAFRLHSPNELGDDGILFLRDLGLDLSSLYDNSGKGKAPARSLSFVSESTLNQTDLHKHPNSVKLEPALVTLRSGPPTTASSSGDVPPNSDAQFAPYLSVSQAPSLSRQVPLLEDDFSGNSGLPPPSAYHILAEPHVPNEYVFPTSSAPRTPTPSRYGVTPAVLMYLPPLSEIQALLSVVDQHDHAGGILDYPSFMQRVAAMVETGPSPNDRPLGLAFLSSVCALLALGNELRRESIYDDRDANEGQMVVDDQSIDSGKGGLPFEEGEQASRQWEQNPNFMSHKGFGTSTHTTTSTLQPFPSSTPSHPFGTNHLQARPSTDRLVDSNFLSKLSAQALWMADSEPQKQPASIDYVLACLWQVKYIFTRARTVSSLPDATRDDVGKMVVVAKQLELDRDPDDSFDGNGDVPREEMQRSAQTEFKRRVWWEVVFYDLFVSDSLNHPPMISSSHLPLPSPSSPLHEYIAIQERDPASMFYETTSPHTTLLPCVLGHEPDMMTEFELRCRLAQLVKIVQVRIMSKNGYSFEQAASYDSELRATLAKFTEEWESGTDVNAAGSQGGMPSALLKAEAAVIINRLVIRLYLPFVRSHQSSASADAPETRARPVLHQAIYGLVNAAHAFLDAARVYVDLRSSTPAPATCPTIPIDFYGFGHMVLDATLICSYAHSTQPTAMWAPQAKEDVLVGADVIASDTARTFWSCRLAGIQSAGHRSSGLGWEDASKLTNLLRNKVSAIHGAAIGRETSSAQSFKRKFSDAQVLHDGEVDEGAVRGEADARHDTTQFDRSLALNTAAMGGDGLEPSLLSPSDPRSRIHSSTPIDFKDPASTATFMVPRSRRLSVSTTTTTSSISTTLTASEVSGAIPKLPRSKKKDKTKGKDRDKDPLLAVRFRDTNAHAPDAPKARMPLVRRARARLALSDADPYSPATPLVDNPFDGIVPEQQPQEFAPPAPPPEREPVHDGVQYTSRSRSSSIRHEHIPPLPVSRGSLASPIAYSSPYSEYSPTHARQPSGPETTPISDVSMPPSHVYAQPTVPYDSPHSYDGSAGGADHTRASSYGSAPSPFGHATSAASSPYTHASGNSMPPPPSNFEPSPPHSSPPVYETPNSVMSAPPNGPFYMTPPPHTSSPYDTHYNQQGQVAYNVPAPYQMKPLDPGAPHDMSMPPTHHQHQQHNPFPPQPTWQHNAAQNAIEEQQRPDYGGAWSQQQNVQNVWR